MTVNYYEPPQQPTPENGPRPSAPRPEPTIIMPAARAKPIGFWRFMGYIGSALTWTRNMLANVLFLLIVLLIIGAMAGNKTQPLPTTFALDVAPTGILVDQRSYLSAAALLTSEENPNDNETVIGEIIVAIDRATTDDRVTSIILSPGNMLGGGISKIDEIGEALNRFRTSGKPIIAVGENFSQDQYYLASYADNILMHELGAVDITGFSRYMTYYKSALDKLGVTVHAFRSGKYKDFLEPYLRDDMSDESREHNARWLDEMWAYYIKGVEERRKLASGTLSNYANHYDTLLVDKNGDSASVAKEASLVNWTGSRSDMQTQLSSLIGHSVSDEQRVNARHYFRQVINATPSKPHKIALIVASGNILPGKQPDGAIGGDSLYALIKQVKNSDEYSALVLRIDSGGGSAFASEIIRDELASLKGKMPVYVSMGSVAASGGYWIATAADKIWAQPTTITGSIGVFGAIPTFEKSLEKIGISVDGVETTDMAGGLRIDRPLNDKITRTIQSSVDGTYDKFITLVAEARGQTKDAINEIAQGRVWTGATAKELGLVDELGTLDSAIKAVAHAADVTDYNVELISLPRSPKEEFLRSFAENAHIGVDIPSLFTGLDSITALTELAPIVKPLHDVITFKDPRNLYVKCFECVTP